MLRTQPATDIPARRALLHGHSSLRPWYHRASIDPRRLRPASPAGSLRGRSHRLGRSRRPRRSCALSRKHAAQQRPRPKRQGRPRLGSLESHRDVVLPTLQLGLFMGRSPYSGASPATGPRRRQCENSTGSSRYSLRPGRSLIAGKVRAHKERPLANYSPSP